MQKAPVRPPISEHDVVRYIAGKAKSGFHGEITLKFRDGRVYEVDEYKTMVKGVQLHDVADSVIA